VLHKWHPSCYMNYVRRVWRYQMGNQNPYIEEQTTQWPKEKVQNDKQWPTKHTRKEWEQSGSFYIVLLSSCFHHLVVSNKEKLYVVNEFSPVFFIEVCLALCPRLFVFCSFSFAHYIVYLSSVSCILWITYYCIEYTWPRTATVKLDRHRIQNWM
jgi:hypothetical protein